MSKQGKLDKRRDMNHNPTGIGGDAKIQWDNSYFEQFEQLCHIQCTQSEIANVMGVDEDTLKRLVEEHYNLTYSAIYKRFSDGGKMSLRRMQFKKAQEGSNTMLIWLGKQYLGQTDKVVNVDIDKAEAEAMQLLQSIQEMVKVDNENEQKATEVCGNATGKE